VSALSAIPDADAFARTWSERRRCERTVHRDMRTHALDEVAQNRLPYDVVRQGPDQRGESLDRHLGRLVE